MINGDSRQQRCQQQRCTVWLHYKVGKTLQSRVYNKRGECLTPHSPVIDDCAEVKWLLFRVTYRLLVFIRSVTAISLAAP